MTRILKFTLEPQGVTSVPGVVKVLGVGWQSTAVDPLGNPVNFDLRLWAEIDPADPTMTAFVAVFTGEAPPNTAQHTFIGTAVGPYLVSHVWRVG